MKMRDLMPLKLRDLLDKVRRKVAYVPAVSDTISAMKDLGIDLKEETKKKQ